MVELIADYRDRLRKMTYEQIKQELVSLKGKEPHEESLPKEHIIAWELLDRIYCLLGEDFAQTIKS